MNISRKRIEAVIDRLKDATEPSGKLDEVIYEAAMGYKKVGGASTRGGMLAEDFWLTGSPDLVICGQVLVGPAPLFTFNIDTAKSLIESGFLFSVEGNASQYQQGRFGKARIWCAPEYSKIESMASVNVIAEGASPALALCIAALTARLRVAIELDHSPPSKLGLP